VSEVLLVIGKPKYVGKGSGKSVRYHVRFLNRDVYLTPKSFSYLTKLAYQSVVTSHWAFEDASGWVRKEQFDCGDCQARYMYNLKKEMGRDAFPDKYKIYPSKPDLIVSDKNGRYKLNIGRPFLSIGYDNLLAFPDHEIRKIGAELKFEAERSCGGKEQNRMD